MSFLNFLGDLKGYIPSLGDIAKTLLFGGLFEDVIPKNDRFFAAPEGEERNKNWYEDDTKGALIYPQDLFSLETKHMFCSLCENQYIEMQRF